MKNSNHFRLFPCVALMAISFFITSCASIPNEQRVDNFPMYGQPEIPRPDSLFKKIDDEFIESATKGFGSREEASKAWFMEGEEFVRKGNLHYAMRRYNQAWLLDPQNYQPYWGFGRVMLERDKFDEAISHLEKAKELINNSTDKPRLFSDMASAYSYKARSIPDGQQEEKVKYFGLADQYYRESTTLDPSYFNAWLRWASLLYLEENYGEAWVKVKKARAIGTKPIPESMLKSLSEKMPEPK